MARMITLREANPGFSSYIRDVEAGEAFVITRNGTPVAQLTPVTEPVLSPPQEAALARTLQRMAQGWPLGAGTLDRAELHER